MAIHTYGLFPMLLENFGRLRSGGSWGNIEPLGKHLDQRGGASDSWPVSPVAGLQLAPGKDEEGTVLS